MSGVSEDYDYDDAFGFPCPHCSGDGEVPCHCGGDLCVCENYGDAPCPVCFGEGDVSEERYDRYMENQRKHRAMLAVLSTKTTGETE